MSQLVWLFVDSAKDVGFLELPDYWLPRPAVMLSDEELAIYMQIWFDAQRSSPLISTIALPPSTQPWRFLHWLVQSEGMLLHGSGRGDIELFSPRAPDGRSADDFSKQTAVYATTDAIWSIYYAVLDRSHGLRHLNACLQFQEGRTWSNPYYFFSLSRSSHGQKPWRRGFVYLLPSAGFAQQPPYSVQRWAVLDPLFANTHEVKPLARVPVKPRDFPLLRSVREHDNAAIMEAQAHDPYGFPWLKYPILRPYD